MATRPSQHRYDTVARAVEGLARWKGCSVILEDASFRLVAHSSHPDAAADKARLRTVLEKRAPKDVVSAMRRRGILRQLHSAREAVRTPALPEVGLNERVVVSVREGATSYGYLWVEDDGNRLASEDLQDITAFAAESVLPLLIDLSRWESAQPEASENFLRELLQGDTPEEETESWVRNEFFPSLTGGFYLAAVRGEGLTAHVVKLRALASGSATHTGVGHVSTWLDGYAYILCASIRDGRNRGASVSTGHTVTNDPLNTFLDGVRETLAEHCKTVGLGVSGPIADLGETTRAASMALRAAFISERFFGGLRVVAADEYPHFAASLPYGTDIQARSVDGSPTACWLERIVSYDRKQSTLLTLTLEQYLDHGGSVSEVASVLHVHPNTLLYRLKRIEQLAKINLRNGAERTLVHVELKLWRAAEEGDVAL